MLSGDNGLLNKASSAKVKNELATVTEQIALAYQDYQIELKTSETTKLASTSIKIAEVTQTKASTRTFLEYLEGKQYIDNNGIVKVQNLVGHKMLLGNGEGESDVYIVSLDTETNKYILTYYDEKSIGTPLWNANSNGKAVKINISKTPETEMSYAVKLQVTSVEGIGMFAKDEEELAQKVSTMSPEKKKEIYKSMTIMMLNEQLGTNFATYDGLLEYEKQQMVVIYNNVSNTNFSSFKQVLDDYNNKNGTKLTENEFFISFGLPIPPIPDDIDNDTMCDAILESFQDKSTGEIISTYEIINQKEEWSNIYVATENGIYEFTVRDILTGETYKKSVEITNIDKSIPAPYYVACEPSSGESEYTTIFLKDRSNSTKEKFENAYLMYKGIKVDISTLIESGYNDEENKVDGVDIAKFLKDHFGEKIENLENKDIEIILVKDGVEYKGIANTGSLAM